MRFPQRLEQTIPLTAGPAALLAIEVILAIVKAIKREY